MRDFTEIKIGRLSGGKTFSFPLTKNSPSSINRNWLLLCKQGSGKTNLYMLIIQQMYENFIQSDGEFGSIPIVFSPLFEFSNLRFPSRFQNLPPETRPSGLDCVNYTFKLANPPDDDEDIKCIYFEFRELEIEDIAGFGGYQDNSRILGYIQKCIEDLSKVKPNYTVDDFILEMKEYGNLKDSLYYTFTKLRQSGLFDNKYIKFDWFEAIKNRKPIIFNFGDIDLREIYSTLSGILLRKLFELSFEYYNAYQKQMRGKSLNEREKFLVDNFYISLFFEESHQILFNTTSTQLLSFPAHYTYKKISDLLGRKKGFKYNFLVTQRVMELYKYFRKQQNYLILGNELFDDDIEYMIDELNFDKKDIPILIGLDKFQFTVINRELYKHHLPKSVSKVYVYRSPCGQP